MTNAVRAQIVVAVNAVLVLLLAFGVNVTDGQQAAIQGGVNALLGLWVAATYHRSPYRELDDDDGGQFTVASHEEISALLDERDRVGKQDGS